MKRCTVCEQNRPKEAFAPRRAQCHDCIRAKDRERYYNSKDWARRRAEQRLRYARAKAIVIELKKNPCTDCGGTFPPYVMQFDHRDPSQKILTVSERTGAGHVQSLLAEIERCDLVCANCHAIRTHRQREAGLVRGGRPRLYG